MSSLRIAAKLFRSEETVRNYVSDRTQAAVVALKHGLVNRRPIYLSPCPNREGVVPKGTGVSYRAKIVSSVIPILLVAGILLRFTLASFHVGIILSDTLYFTAFVLIDLFVLRQCNDEWERPPERNAK